MFDITLDRGTLIRGLVDDNYTVSEVAMYLCLSERRVLQLKKAFIEQGEDALTHGNLGRHPPNRMNDRVRDKIIALKKSPYYKRSNVNHFRELLAEYENIEISYSALSDILKSAGIELQRQHRKGIRLIRWRKSKEAIGEILEIAAVRRDWLGDGNSCVLHGSFDDATRRITGLYLCMEECMMGYLEVMRQTFSDHGFPMEIYSEKDGLFFGNRENRTGSRTMLGHIVEDVFGIGITDPHTIQKKGCMERLCTFLQGHLMAWFKMHYITDIDMANRRIHHCITLYNNNFTVKPRKAESLFEPLNESYDLDRLLAVRHELTTDGNGCFLFKNFMFRVDSPRPPARKKIWFLFGCKVGFLALHDREYLPVLLLGLKNEERVVEVSDALDILVREGYYGKP